MMGVIRWEISREGKEGKSNPSGKDSCPIMSLMLVIETTGFELLRSVHVKMHLPKFRMYADIRLTPSESAEYSHSTLTLIQSNLHLIDLIYCHFI